jgi:hypothetical protein
LVVQLHMMVHCNGAKKVTDGLGLQINLGKKLESRSLLVRL